MEERFYMFVSIDACVSIKKEQNIIKKIREKSYKPTEGNKLGFTRPYFYSHKITTCESPCL